MECQWTGLRWVCAFWFGSSALGIFHEKSLLQIERPLQPGFQNKHRHSGPESNSQCLEEPILDQQPSACRTESKRAKAGVISRRALNESRSIILAIACSDILAVDVPEFLSKSRNLLGIWDKGTYLEVAFTEQGDSSYLDCIFTWGKLVEIRGWCDGLSSKVYILFHSNIAGPGCVIKSMRMWPCGRWESFFISSAPPSVVRPWKVVSCSPATQKNSRVGRAGTDQGCASRPGHQVFKKHH